MTADHAKAIADYFAAMFDQESANTLKVLRAVPDSRRDYKPDEKSRTAWELATHLASSDLWFLDSVCDAVFVYDPEVENKRTAGLNTIDEVVEFYKREYPKRIERLRSTPGEQLAKEVDFFGMTKGPSIWFLGLGKQPWCPSPRPVDDLPPSDGFESAVDLRRQRRRALPGRIAAECRSRTFERSSTVSDRK
jgi:hypothetical protein